MNTELNIKIGYWLAGSSCVIGILFCLFNHLLITFTSKDIIVPGFLFLLLAFAINSLYLFFLIVNMIFEKDRRNDIAATILVMLFNIPVAILCAMVTLSN